MNSRFNIHIHILFRYSFSSIVLAFLLILDMFAASPCFVSKSIYFWNIVLSFLIGKETASTLSKVCLKKEKSFKHLSLIQRTHFNLPCDFNFFVFYQHVNICEPNGKFLVVCCQDFFKYYLCKICLCISVIKKCKFNHKINI